MFFVFAKTSLAATIYAASCSQPDVQTAINSASDGDTIQIPAGACSWDNYISVNTKSSRTKMVKIIGAGSGSDPASNTIITANNSTHQNWGYGGKPVFVFWLHRNLSGLRVAYIRFVQNVNVGEEDDWAIEIAGHADTYSSLFRIDHCYFQFKAGQYSNAIHVGSVNGVDTSGTNDMGHPYIWGLFDHNTFSGSVSIQTVDVMPIYDVTSPGVYTYIGNGGWRDYSNSEHQGTWKNVFFEDNTFTSVSAIDSQAALDGNGGAALVIRYNTIKNNWINGHGADSGSRSIKWVEIYNNTMLRDASSGAYFGSAVNSRGGTGVMYNNNFYDASHKGTGNPLGITGTDNWPDGITLQYYRAFAARGGDGICASVMCGDDSKLGCDNKDHTGGIDDGWICRDQPGAAKGATASGWAYGYKWATEPFAFWNNYWSNTSSLASVVTTDGLTANYVVLDRDYTVGTTAKAGYVAYTYPHPLVVESAPPDTTPPAAPSGVSII